METEMMGAMVGHRPDARVFKESADICDNAVFVGMEIEVENYFHKDAFEKIMSLWKITDDGSLRDRGVEYVSVPVRGKDIVRALKQLDELIKLHKPRLNFSERCGLHIHVDGRDLSVDQFKKWIFLYVCYEKILYKYAANNRENNIFCLPFYKAEHGLRMLSDFNSSPSKHIISAAQKYQGMNIGPMVSQGSVEFRFHEATADVSKIQKWINILLRLRNSAVNLQESPEELVAQSTEVGQIRFMEQIFREYFNDLYYKGMEKDILSGIRHAQEVIFNNKLGRLARKLDSADSKSPLFVKFIENNYPKKEANIFISRIYKPKKDSDDIDLFYIQPL